MSSPFYTAKIFDSIHFPRDVRDYIIQNDMVVGNDSYFPYVVGKNGRDLTVLDKVLIESGVEINEKVLINYWW